MDSLKTILYK